MLLSYHKLCDLVRQGVIEGAPLEHVNAASIDLTLSDRIMVDDMLGGVVDPTDPRTSGMLPERIPADGYLLEPGEMILASTREVFHLPATVSGMFVLRSSFARAGLEHLQAGWMDAGWHGSSLTLELINMRNRPLLLRPGVRIGQAVLFEHEAVPEWANYASKGKYNGDGVTAQSSKGVV